MLQLFSMRPRLSVSWKHWLIFWENDDTETYTLRTEIKVNNIEEYRVNASRLFLWKWGLIGMLCCTLSIDLQVNLLLPKKLCQTREGGWNMIQWFFLFARHACLLTKLKILNWFTRQVVVSVLGVCLVSSCQKGSLLCNWARVYPRLIFFLCLS